MTCRTAANGRRAVRALADWAQRFGLGEPEFQVLWSLRWSHEAGLDQTSLAKSIACSPAQVSATVERIRLRGWIAQRHSPSDRRRNLWQLTAEGNQLLDQMLVASSALCPCETADHAVPTADQQSPEAAA